MSGKVVFTDFEGHMRMVLASKIGSASQYFHFFSKGVLWDMDEPITARDVHAHITEKCLFQALLFCKKWRTYFGLKCRIRHKPASEKPILLCIKFNRRVNCNWFLKMNNSLTEISHFLWKHFYLNELKLLSGIAFRGKAYNVKSLVLKLELQYSLPFLDHHFYKCGFPIWLFHSPHNV